MAYAIFTTGGKQYRVNEGDLVDVEKLDAAVGDVTTFDQILLIGEGDAVTVGTPHVAGASVTAEVVAQHRDKKVTAFKFRRRKGFHKTKGHRRMLTRLSIKSIAH
jgi:large subunit ribosomal protein L21